MAKTIGTVITLKDKFSTPLKEIAKKLNTTEKELKKATITIKKYQDQASKGFKTAALGAVGMGAAIAGAVGVAVNSTLAYAGEVKKMQRLTGESVENASKMVAVGKKYGISADSMAKSLRMLSIKATNNSKDFAKYGLTVKNAHDQLLPASKILEKVADKYKQLGGGLKGAVFAQKLMGRGCMDLIPVLSKGSAGIKAMEADASRMGLVLSKNNIDSFSKFSEAQKRFNQALLGIQVTIGSKVLPYLGQLAEKVNIAINKFDFKKVGLVTDQILKNIGNTIKFVVNNLNWLIPVLGIATTVFAGLKILVTIGQAMKAYGEITAALKVTQGLWNAQVLISKSLTLAYSGVMTVWSGVCKIATGVQWLFNAALDANPIGITIVGIGALVAGGIALYKNWGFVCQKAKELWDWLKKITGFGNKTISVNAKVNKTENKLPDNKKIPHHSLGSAYFAGGTTHINEGGRGEIVTLPSGSKIHNHNDSKKMMNKGKNIKMDIHVHGNVIGNKEFLNQLGAMFTDRVLMALGNI